MKSPWREIRPMEPDSDYVVLASSIPARQWRSTPRLFRGSRAVAAQLERTDGVVGFSMLARPLRRQYGTLSIWRDESSLRAFAQSPPHRELMSTLIDEMADTRFERWTIRGAQGRPRWREAMTRLELT